MYILPKWKYVSHLVELLENMDQHWMEQTSSNKPTQATPTNGTIPSLEGWDENYKNIDMLIIEKWTPLSLISMHENSSTNKWER